MFGSLDDSVKADAKLGVDADAMVLPSGSFNVNASVAVPAVPGAKDVPLGYVTTGLDTVATTGLIGIVNENGAPSVTVVVPVPVPSRLPAPFTPS